MFPTVMRGLRDAYGSWKTICISRRIRRRSCFFIVVSSSPRNCTEPEVGLSSSSTQ